MKQAIILFNVQINLIQRRMSNSLHIRLDEIKLYIKLVVLEGIDINALYIIQAYLTIQASLRPSQFLVCLFPEQALDFMDYVLAQFEQQVSSHQSSLNQRTYKNLLKYFKISSKDINIFHPDNITHELAQLIRQISQTFDQWDSISRQAGNITDRINRQLKEENLKNVAQQGLQSLLNHILASNQCENTTNGSHEMSFLESQALWETKNQTQRSEIVLFLQYVSMWIGQIVQQIQEFKSILKFTKEDSSVDFQVELKNRRVDLQKMKQTKNTKRKGKNYSKVSLLTEKIRINHLENTRVDIHDFDEEPNGVGIKIRGKQNEDRSKVKEMAHSERNFSSKSSKSHKERTQSHRALLSSLDFHTNILSDAKQKRSKAELVGCSKCEIY